MRALRYLLLNTFMGVCLYYGIFQGVAGALNIFIGITFLLAFGATFMLQDETKEKFFLKNGYPKIPIWISVPIEIAIVAVLFWGGCWWTAIAEIWQCVMMAHYTEYCNKQGPKA